MPCPHRRKALKVLMGELRSEESSRMLEHCRVCGECREAFDFAAATITRTAGAANRMDDVGTGRGDEPVTSAPLRGGWPNPVRRNRRILLVFGVAVLALMFAGIGKGRGDPAQPGEPSDDVLWRRLLSVGTPVVQSPAGSFDGRPRVITALVPPGSGSFSVAILDQSGRVVFQRDEKPGERGCFVEECEIAAPGRSFRAGKFVAPFPEETEVALRAGRSYGVLLAVAGGHASASSVFQVSR